MKIVKQELLRLLREDREVQAELNRAIIRAMIVGATSGATGENMVSAAMASIAETLAVAGRAQATLATLAGPKPQRRPS